MTIDNSKLKIQNSELREKLASIAMKWIGVPYEHRGTTRKGCDCTGILIGIAGEMGFLEGYELRQYPVQWNLHSGAGNQVIEEIERFAERIENAEAGPGDIAVMRFGRCPAHCGIIVDDNGLMVHSLKTNGRVTYGMLRNSMWSKRWCATYRINEEKLVLSEVEGS